MDPTYRIRNDKGLFVPVHPWALISKATVEGLRREVLPSMEGKERAELGAALDALEGLPVVPQHLDCTRFDSQFDPAKHDQYLRDAASYQSRRSLGYVREPDRQNAVVDAYGWYAPDAPRGASESTVPCRNPQAAGWLGVGEFAKRADAVNAALARIEAGPIHEFRYKGARVAAKRAKELTFELVERTEELASADYWLLFNGGPGGGFLDPKGRYGPLARARGFESAAAAQRTAKSHGLGNWKVVQGRTELVALESFPGDSVDDALAAAMARQESMALRKALEGATVDALRERLAQLEGTSALSTPGRKSRL